MKKNLLLLTLTIALFTTSFVVSGQNLVAGGDMEDQGLWDTVGVIVPTHPVEFAWGYSTLIPTAGSGGCLNYISSAGPTDGVFNNDVILFHPITVTPGKTYKISGAVRDLTTGGAKNFWTEIGISINNPKDSLKVGASYIMAMNTWDGCGAEIDGTFEENSCKYLVNDKPNQYYHVSDELTGDQTFYLVIEIGTWNDAAEERSYDFLVDEINVVDSAGGASALYFPKAEDGIKLSNYPSPASQISNISYTLPTSGDALIQVYNMLGEKVETLVNEFKAAGHYTISFDASNLPASMYYYRLDFNGNTYTDKVLIVR